jgi:hypothetical protein
MTGAMLGNSMLYFPEFHKSFEYFDMDPKINDGFENRTTLGNYLGVFHNDKSGIRNANGNRVRFIRYYLWTEANMDPGKYVRFEDVNYTIVFDTDWPTQGGFYRYELQKVVGSNGTDTLVGTSFVVDGSQY